MSKRLLLARTMQNFGITRMVEYLKPKPGILIINHHRIGDAMQTRFDRGVFSATVEQLEAQVKYVRGSLPVIGGEELDALVSGAKPLKRMHVAFTFDDGYLDNYAAAFPVMRAQGVPAFFFLVPEYVGSDTVPWWDEIAFLVRNSPKSALNLRTPAALEVALEGDRERAIYFVLQHYKRPDNTDSERFLAELREQAACSVPSPGRRFLNWSEAAAMRRSGMTIGSHTLTHRILAQLPEAEQARELKLSRAAIELQLGGAITALAYPVGSTTAFTSTTEQLARDTGYKACMSFYGGINRSENLQPMNLLRTSVEPDPLMFRNQVTFLSRLGRLPY